MNISTMIIYGTTLDGRLMWSENKKGTEVY